MIASLYGFSSDKECTDAPLKMWIEVETCYYIFNLLFLFSYYQYLKKYNKENVKFLIFNCILNVYHVSWLIYGNALYFPHTGKCSDEWKAASATGSQSITWVMLGLILIGYIPMIKCCSFGTLIICCAPTIYRSIRRANRPDAQWHKASGTIVKNIMKKKFVPNDHPEGAECSICMVEYEESDTVT